MSCVEKCQPQNTHVLLLKSSFFFQTEEKILAFFFLTNLGFDLPTQFLVHLWHVRALLIFCPTRSETRALSVVETMLNQFIIWTNLDNLITEAQQHTEVDMRLTEHLGKISRASTIFYFWESWKGDHNLNRFAGPEITRQLILGCFQPAVHPIMWQLLDKPAWCCQTALPSHCLEIWLIWKKKYKWPSHLSNTVQMARSKWRHWYWGNGRPKMWLRKRNNFWHWQWCRCLFVRML